MQSNAHMKTFFDRQIFNSSRALNALQDIYRRSSGILIVDADQNEVTNFRKKLNGMKFPAGNVHELDSLARISSFLAVHADDRNWKCELIVASAALLTGETSPIFVTFDEETSSRPLVALVGDLPPQDFVASIAYDYYLQRPVTRDKLFELFIKAGMFAQAHLI